MTTLGTQSNVEKFSGWRPEIVINAPNPTLGVLHTTHAERTSPRAYRPMFGVVAEIIEWLSLDEWP